MILRTISASVLYHAPRPTRVTVEDGRPLLWYDPNQPVNLWEWADLDRSSRVWKALQQLAFATDFESELCGLMREWGPLRKNWEDARGAYAQWGQPSNSTILREEPLEDIRWAVKWFQSLSAVLVERTVKHNRVSLFKDWALWWAFGWPAGAAPADSINNPRDWHVHLGVPGLGPGPPHEDSRGGPSRLSSMHELTDWAHGKLIYAEISGHIYERFPHFSCSRGWGSSTFPVRKLPPGDFADRPLEPPPLCGKPTESLPLFLFLPGEYAGDLAAWRKEVDACSDSAWKGAALSSALYTLAPWLESPKLIMDVRSTSKGTPEHSMTFVAKTLFEACVLQFYLDELAMVHVPQCKAAGCGNPVFPPRRKYCSKQCGDRQRMRDYRERQSRTGRR